MKPLFPIEKINEYKCGDKVPFECEFCQSTFYSSVKNLKYRIKKDSNYNLRFCSNRCQGKNFNKRKIKKCKQCGKERVVKNIEIKKSKTGNFFCSRSCAATYNNTHKKHGTRRSKLEFWIEMKLSYDFPDLKVLINNRDTINAELDFYFPDLKLAVELNGIFHYEPIYGKEKLDNIRTNDEKRFQACLEHEIELLIINISSLGHFKPHKADVFYNIVKNNIIQKLGPTKKITNYPDFEQFIIKTKKNNYKNKYTRCLVCNKEKLNKNKFCSKKCGKIGRKKIYNFNWDSIDLIELKKENSYAEIAKKLGCSRIAVFKHHKQLLQEKGSNL